MRAPPIMTDTMAHTPASHHVDDCRNVAVFVDAAGAVGMSAETSEEAPAMSTPPASTANSFPWNGIPSPERIRSPTMTARNTSPMTATVPEIQLT